MATVERTDRELDALPLEDLLQHVAILKHEYLVDARAWIEHRDQERTDRKFAAYSRALRFLKKRQEFAGVHPDEVQRRIDAYL